MRSLFLALALAALLGGCATKEGIKLPTGAGPTKESLDDFNKRNSGAQPIAAPGALPRDTVKTALVPDAAGPRMIIIGNVMALTAFDDATLNSRYDNYLKRLQAHSATPAFTRDWYLATGSGETAVKFSGITGLYTRFFKAELPKDLMRQITFASPFGTFMAGTSGDLVAAERSPTYGTWVTRLLCSEKSTDYATCESRYQRGLYQAVDGREIDDKLQIVEAGRTIDPVTYALAPSTVVGTTQGQNKPETPAQPAFIPAAAPAQLASPVSAAPLPAAQPSKDVAQQLGKLNELRAKGLISDGEYQAKRKEILDSL